MLKQILLCLALGGATAVFAAEGVSEMATQLFGTEEAEKRVSDGAVFIDGQFVRAPYSVTRKGNVILVNGRIASRFKVEANAAKLAAAAGEDEGKDASGSGEGYVSEEDGASIGSDDTPTLEDSPAATESAAKTSAIDAKLAKRGGGSIEERLAAKRKARDLKSASASGSFNTDAVAKDPMALFEEADYTYTPPSKPEAKPVPYVRPAAQKPIAERMAEARAKDATAQKTAMRTAAAEETEGDDEGDEDVVAVEEFDDLTEEEIERYTKAFTARRARIEKVLAADGMVLLSSASSGMKAVPRSTMWRFVQQVGPLCDAPGVAKLQNQWGTALPRGYLQRIYDNRAENEKNMKTLILRVKRESKNAKQRSRI